MRGKLLAAVVAIALIGSSCSGDDDDDSGGNSASGAGTEVATTDVVADFTAAGSINAAYVLDAEPGSELVLADIENTEVATATVDDLGSAVFYDIEPGAGYRVVHEGTDETASSESFAVLSADDEPDPTLYEQEMTEGLNYVRMRDGVELAMTVRLPAGATIDAGPFPTVIEHSGYQVAAPKDLFQDVVARLADPALPPDPLVPSTSTAVGSLITPVLGYATVSVQMRGTGCSGGAFDLFDLPTTYDGYDMVETVAAQDWVKGNKVGMVGISFSGFSQLFAAGTNPPSLAGVAPMSVTDDFYRTAGFPGGIYNDGFAQSWLEERAEDAKPAPEGGQAWAKELVAQGDEHCIANQKLHGQARDVFSILADNPDRVPELNDKREPARWAAQIEAPIFIAGAFHDEQIFGVGPGLVEGLADNPDAYVTLMNGTHVDPLGPAVITRWAEFLSLYVADAVPELPQSVLDLSGALYAQIASAPAAPVQQSRFAGRTDLEAVREEYRRDPRVRVIMDIGGGPAGPGALEAVWEMAFDAWPPTDVAATPYYLGPEGTLVSSEPGTEGSDTYTSDASARARTNLPEGDPWHGVPGYVWEPVSDGNGLGFVTEPLTEDVVIAGPASADVYVSSTAADTDLQVTISELRADGTENYVQFGVLRASYRALADDATDLEARHPYDAREDLVAGEPTLVRVPIFPVAYAFRAGSRIRLTIQAPGGERPRWTFATTEDGSTENTIGSGGATPSALMLPVVPGQAAGGPLPPCGALRGTACRAYTPAANGG